jgi:hypothetical protein
MDLLSGDDYIKTEPANSLALVPVTEYSAADKNVLAFADMFEQNTANNSNHNLPNSFQSSTSNSTISTSQTYPAPVRPVLPQHSAADPNGARSNAIVPYDQQSQLNSTGSWNGQTAYGTNHQKEALSYGTRFLPSVSKKKYFLVCASSIKLSWIYLSEVGERSISNRHIY